jgi:RimJ/RimL family protein N-acetyltransferase
MYERFGFGMFLVELKHSGVAIGACGLIKREALSDPDIGYALLPEFWGKGYALEAARAVIEYGRRIHNLPRILAITSPDNDRSVRVLESCGMQYQCIVPMADKDVKLFEIEFAPWSPP